jgi:hypothetical protein
MKMGQKRQGEMRPSDWFAPVGITAAKFNKIVQTLEGLEPLTRQSVILAASDEDDLRALVETALKDLEIEIDASVG